MKDASRLKIDSWTQKMTYPGNDQLTSCWNENSLNNQKNNPLSCHHNCADSISRRQWIYNTLQINGIYVCFRDGLRHLQWNFYLKQRWTLSLFIAFMKCFDGLIIKNCLGG